MKKKDEANIMPQDFDIDQNIEPWLSAYESVINNGKPTCPYCKSSEISVIKDADEDGIGFMLITCEKCGKRGHFSRVKI